MINPQLMQQLQLMSNIYKHQNNPEALIQSLSKTNPQLQQVMQMCQGKDPQQVFMQMCQQRGVNPDEILKYFR